MRSLPGVLTTRHRLLLIAAALVPVVYFGAQALAAPYFPGYSIYTTSASALGSDLSTRPGVLNSGAFLTGILAILGAAGFALSLPRVGVGKIASSLLALCLLSAGAASLWASQHPLPDPRHNPGALGAGLFAMPFVSAWVASRLRPSRAVLALFVLDVLAFVALGTVMSGAAGIDLAKYGGLVQKLIGVATMAASAGVALLALQRAQRPAA